MLKKKGWWYRRSYSFFLFCCATACGILVPQPGIKPMSPAVEAQSLNHWIIREAPEILFLIFTLLLLVVHETIVILSYSHALIVTSTFSSSKISTYMYVFPWPLSYIIDLHRCLLKLKSSLLKIFLSTFHSSIYMYISIHLFVYHSFLYVP